MNTEEGTPTSTGKSYKPREDIRHRGDVIRTHAERTQRLQGTWKDGEVVTPCLLPADWRKGTLIDLSHCQHTVCSFFEVENEHGIWGMEICNNCGTQVRRECPHVSNTWNPEGTVLTCDNCGIDGT